MRAVRFTLGALGVASVAWGVWLLRDDGADRLASTVTWLAGGVILHDFVLAPLVVLVGLAAVKLFPDRRRAVVAIAFLVWATLTAAVANVLLDVGGKPGMDSLLHRPYVIAWLVLTAVVVVAAVAAHGLRSSRASLRPRHPG
jgi:hypothetical protein